MTGRVTERVLIEELKRRMRAAMQEHDRVAKDILGLALGEIQTAEARANRPLADDEATAIVRRLVKSNEETLGHAQGAQGAQGAHGESDNSVRLTELRREIEVLSALLPRTLSPEAVAEALAPVTDALRAAKTEGQAMGMAMKHLKATGAAVEAAAVQQAVKAVRSSS